MEAEYHTNSSCGRRGSDFFAISESQFGELSFHIGISTKSPFAAPELLLAQLPPTKDPLRWIHKSSQFFVVFPTTYNQNGHPLRRSRWCHHRR